MLLILSCIINFASLSFPIYTATCSRYGIEHVLFCYRLPVRNTSCDFSSFQAFVFFNRLRAIGVLIIIIKISVYLYGTKQIIIRCATLCKKTSTFLSVWQTLEQLVIWCMCHWLNYFSIAHKTETVRACR